MSYRKDVRGRVARGEYVQKSNALEEGFAKAADIVAKSWMDTAAQEKADAKALAKDQAEEEKENRRRIREKQEAADLEDKKYKDIARSALSMTGGSFGDNTTAFQTAYTMAKGGSDVTKISDYFISGLESGSIERLDPQQGPGMPRNVTSIDTLTDQESGKGGANALLNQAQNGAFSDIVVSEMTVKELMDFQSKRGEGSYHAWSKVNMPESTEAYRKGLGSTPAGKYQFVGDTMQELKRNGTFESLGITDDTVFDEETQDALFLRYAQDRLKGKNTNASRISTMRDTWEGLKNVSDEDVLSVIEQVETGVFDSNEVVEDRRPFRGADLAFSTAKRKFDPVSIENIKTYADWEATNASITANKTDVSPEFMEAFNTRGKNLKALDSTQKVEELFSMKVLLADDMDADMLKGRIALAEAKGMEVPAYIAKDVLPIIEARKEYSQKELFEMPNDQRALVAKYSNNPETRAAAARINEGDVNTYSWISEASSSADAMTAKSREFFEVGDLANFNLAASMAKSLKDGELPYKDLLKPTYLVGKNGVELDSIKRIAEQGGATDKELSALQGEIDAAKELEKNGLYRKYIDSATSVNTTEKQITLAKKEGAGNDVIQALENLKTNQQANSERQKAVEKNGFGIVTVEAKVPLGDGKFEYKTIYQKPREEVYRDAEGNEVKTALPLGEIETDAFKTIRTETQKIITELGVANTALAEGMNTASQAIEIVEEDARVAGAGGKLAKFLASAGRSGGQVLSVAEELFKSNEEITLDQLQRQGGFDNNFLDAVISGNVQNLADATARFEAKMLSLAFQVGRMEGQSGNAMSNQDFTKIMDIVRTSGGSAEAFKKNLTDYMAGKIGSYDQKHFKVVGPGSQIQGFKDKYGWSPVSEPLNMADYVAAQTSQSLKDNYARFTGAPIEQPKVTFPTPNSKAIEFLRKNPNEKAAFEQKYGPGSSANYISKVEGN